LASAGQPHAAPVRRFLGSQAARSASTPSTSAGRGCSDIFDDPLIGDVIPPPGSASKQLRSNVGVFSQNLADEGFVDLTTSAGTLSGRAPARDQSWAFEFRHEPSIGVAERAAHSPGAAYRRRRIAGTPGFPESRCGGSGSPRAIGSRSAPGSAS
jgi:hypothetical protein